AGVYAGDPARLSVQHAFPKMYALEQKYGSLILGQILGARERKERGEASKQSAKNFSFDEGLQVLTDTLHARLAESVRLESCVRSLQQGKDGWTVTVVRAGREEQQDHTAVLFTAPAHKLP